MDRVFSRQEIIERLSRSVEAGTPIVGASPCNGIAAKCAARAGADFIVATPVNTSRSMGFPTRLIADFRAARTMEMFEVFEQVVNDVPLIVGLDAADVFSLDHRKLLDRFQAAGVDGFTNLPTVQMYANQYRYRATNTRRGFETEVKLIAAAHARGLFTVGYVYYADDAVAMLDAGADVIVATAGLTQGGTDGYPEQTYEQALAKIKPVAEAVKAHSSRAFCIGHGGPFNSPEASAVLYENTVVDGIFAGSALDRIPIEVEVRAVIEAYKRPLSELV